MVRNKNMKGVQKGRKRNAPATGATPSLAGDIPPRQRTDYSTSSIRPPPTTGQVTMRQSGPLLTLAASTLADVTQGLSFALSGVNGAGTLASAFDFYRIDAVRVTVRPNNNAVQVVDPSVTKLVPLYWVIDYNDTTALTSAAVALEYDNCMVLNPGESATRTFQPRYSMVVRSASGTDYVNHVGDWINSSSDDVLHFGSKIFIPQVNAAQAVLQTWTVQLEYYLTFRQVV
jgi:hypothetical protein